MSTATVPSNLCVVLDVPPVVAAFADGVMPVGIAVGIWPFVLAVP
ncbi:MAG: hypothetical protein ABI969_05770 [bacterium]